MTIIKIITCTYMERDLRNHMAGVFFFFTMHIWIIYPDEIIRFYPWFYCNSPPPLSFQRHWRATQPNHGLGQIRLTLSSFVTGRVFNYFRLSWFLVEIWQLWIESVLTQFFKKTLKIILDEKSTYLSINEHILSLFLT